MFEYYSVRMEPFYTQDDENEEFICLDDLTRGGADFNELLAKIKKPIINIPNLMIGEVYQLNVMRNIINGRLMEDSYFDETWIIRESLMYVDDDPHIVTLIAYSPTTQRYHHVNGYVTNNNEIGLSGVDTMDESRSEADFESVGVQSFKKLKTESPMSPKSKQRLLNTIWNSMHWSRTESSPFIKLL